MNHQSKRTAVQVKLSPSQLKTFHEVQKMIGSKSISATMRALIVDEKLLYLAAHHLGKDRQAMMKLLKKSWQQQGRPTMLQSLLTIHGNSVDLKSLQKAFDDLDALLQGLLWDAGNLTSSLNQVAHAANAAAKYDPSDVETWQWVINSLNQIMPAAQSLKDSANKVKHFINGDDSK